MFSEKQKDKSVLDPKSSQNLISKGTKLIGDLTSEGDLRIDGTIEGNVNTPGKVVVGKTGYVNGTLNGTDAHFEGKFSGKLSVKGTLTLKATAFIEGEVEVGKLAVEPGATFNVTCAMKGAVKDFNQGEQKQTKQGRSA
ncbi:MAG: polymer-forming cytoskeletal protein [Algicola sp.]|nr:polymer-forming cytoskeletal protein [Algicola sp.]